MTDRVVIFVHLPKAAGSTLNRVIGQHYTPAQIYKTAGKPTEVIAAELAGNATRPAPVRLLAGHVAFGVHQALTEPSTYITVLRKPVERMVSHYDYARNLPQHHLHAEIAGGLTLRDAAQRMANLQTRYLADESVRGTAETAGRDALESAKENLARHFAVAGLSERFEETLMLLQRRLGWKIRAVSRSNVTRGRGKRSEPCAADRAFIHKINGLDRELHDWVRARFEEEVAKEGRGFRHAVRWLRFRNRTLHLRDSLIARARRKAS